jgi:hypothetical protein
MATNLEKSLYRLSIYQEALAKMEWLKMYGNEVPQELKTKTLNTIKQQLWYSTNDNKEPF